MGDTGDLVHVERVENKFKRTKLNMYTPSDPVKVTRKHKCSHISNSNISLAIAVHLAKVMNLAIVMSLANAINFAKMKILANSNTTHHVRKMPRLESQPLQL